LRIFRRRCSPEARPDVRKDSRKAAHVLLRKASMRSLPARVSSLMFLTLALVAMAILPGCGATPDPVGGEGATTYGAEVTPDPNAAGGNGDNGDNGEPDGALVAADDTTNIGTVHEGLTAASQMRTTANVNLRKGAATSFAVIAVIPSGTLVTLVSATPQNGFLNITFSGTNGWSSATYLAAVASTGGSSSSSSSSGGSSSGGTGTVSLDGPPSPDNALARAKLAVGFSYYWGGGAWQAAGASSSNKGSCSGSCPSCSHSGKYGADCSGLIAKAWQFGAENLETNSHPYATSSFVSDSSGHWSTVSRTSMKKGDAMVYNNGSAGHIVLYEKGDGWGTPTVVECRGCAYGCVYNARSFSSTFHAIRRAGF
jgi:uncharacterized protein YraI